MQLTTTGREGQDDDDDGSQLLLQATACRVDEGCEDRPQKIKDGQYDKVLLLLVIMTLYSHYLAPLFQDFLSFQLANLLIPRS